MRKWLVMLLMVIGCSSPAPVSSTTTEPANPQPANPQPANAQPPTPNPSSGPRIIFPDKFVVSVELAVDDETRAQGLMYRDHIDPDKGMLFVFPQDDVFSFWMKNTRIPLDMIWIDSAKRIAGLKENVPPCHVPDCPSYGPGVVARYVLEIGGGEAAKHKLKVGDPLQFIDTEGEAR
jgi:uncharacterized membrane protein (UPF0127 family)